MINKTEPRVMAWVLALVAEETTNVATFVSTRCSFHISPWRHRCICGYWMFLDRRNDLQTTNQQILFGSWVISRPGTSALVPGRHDSGLFKLTKSRLAGATQRL
jgi:hypothetical protein